MIYKQYVIYENDISARKTAYEIRMYEEALKNIKCMEKRTFSVYSSVNEICGQVQ